MAKQQTTPVPAPPKPLKTASQRQGEYVQRLKAKGYVPLSGVFVPAQARAEVREAIKKFVADWEARNVEQF
jgi:hypothetical protein